MAENGFGLNYDRGFNSRSGGTFNVGQLQNQAFDPYASRLRDKSQFGYQSSLMGQQGAQQAAQQERQLAFSREQLAQQGALGTAQIQASMLPAQLQQQRFQTLLPIAQNALNGSLSATNAGAQVGTQPKINAAPVYNDAMIQQQVNAQRAQNDATVAGKQRDLAGQMAGRGYGSQSPLAMALNQSLQGQNLAANTANEQDLRWKAASGNASQLLEGQKAQEVQFANRQQENLERNKIVKGQQTSLLGYLMGMA